MHLILNGLAFLGVVRRRVLSHLGLVLALWAGFTLAVALVVSIPVYAEAAGYRILLAELDRDNALDALPPFSMIYSYGGAGKTPITWAHYQRANNLAADLAAVGIDLPTTRTGRYAATDQLRVMFPDSADKEVLWARVAFVSGFENHVRLVEGDWPAPRNGSGPIDVLVSETAANKYSLLVEDVYQLHVAVGSTPDLNLPVRVAGIWRPVNPDSDYWFFPPSTYTQMLIVPEASFAAIVNDPATPWLYAAAWYAALDVTAVRGGDVPGLIDRIGHATTGLDRVLPNITLSRSPVEALARHRDQVRLLTVTLALFSVPLLGLIGYFIVQAAGMVVQRQQQEIAVLRSRGSSRPQVLALALGEGLALGTAALLVGVPLSLLAAQLIAWTQSFLHFVPLPGPRVELLAASWLHGALVVACVLPSILIPALKASGRTIISYKQERARSVRAPLWQRLFLDILLLVPALYGYQQLRLHGMLGVPGVAASADDPFRNPVMVLAPALLVFALALLALRLVPQMLKLLAWLLSRAPGVALLALRFLGRATQAYSTPVLLITLTLSLATFTASMARTLDQHSYARARYGGGADVRLGPAPASPPSGTTGDPSAGATSTDTSSLDYLFVPVDDFLQTEGVEAVTRVAPSDVFVAPGGGVQEEGTFLGIDRETLPAVLAESWRADYAPESLGALMNRLAQDPASALVAAGYAAERGLRTGDRITVRMNNLGTTREVPFVIAGTVSFFPTLYSEGGPFVIGNLDYSAEAQGGQYPYEIWMDLAPNARLTAVEAVALGYGLRILNDTPQALLEADLLRPERQGLFGLLSVGFLAATLVTILGFLAYTLVSFQRRLVELGMLRAIGLGAGQLASLLIYEQALVIGVGTSVGTLLGVLGSRLFVPFLQVRVGEFPDTPPFVVQIAWDQIALVYGVAAGLLLLTVGATLLLLRRMRIFEAVKLGEAV